MLERFFPERRANQKKEYISSLISRAAILYTKLPDGPETHIDGPCGGTIIMTSLKVLDEAENDFLHLGGARELSVSVQMLARGDESWIGFSVNGRRIKMMQKEEAVEIHFEERREGGWNLHSIKNTDWERLEAFLGYIEEELIG